MKNAHTSTKKKIMKKCAIMHCSKGREREIDCPLKIIYGILLLYVRDTSTFCRCWRSKDRDSIVKCVVKPKHEGWDCKKYKKIVESCIFDVGWMNNTKAFVSFLFISFFCRWTWTWSLCLYISKPHGRELSKMLF